MLSQILVATVYFPLARGAKVIERLGAHVDGLPMSQYRHYSFYTCGPMPSTASARVWKALYKKGNTGNDA